MATNANASTGSATQENPGSDEKVAYLFTYFTGNAPEEEQICYALSDDGYNFTPLNHGNPVIKSDSIALTGCVRDPHILRCEDGKTFYMVVTDMRSSLGWSSNRGMVLLKSTDLINWQHSTVHFPTKYPKTWGNVIRVWAPETVYDNQTGKYMVFYSLRTSDDDSFDRIYYSYVNDDFTDLVGEPVYMFDNGNATIDGDIVYNEKDQLYHLFYKSESGRGIFQATAKQLTAEKGKRPGSQWTMIPGNVEQTQENVEGVGVCKSLDGKSWIIMYDCYMNGHYQYCKSEDLKTFEFVQNTKTEGKFTPRHGTIIPITQAEKDRLLKEFGNYNNPILPGFHADPEVLYSNKTGKFYIYSTTDGYKHWGGYKFNVFSSENLIDWTDEGTMLDVKSEQVKWAKGSAWAPCIEEKKQKDGSYKYYFYYSADAGKRKEIGVAVADSPTGPFTDFGKPIISDSPVGHGQQIDVDVFTDPKSGKSYIYWGNGYMAGAELNDDMTSLKENTITVMTPQGGSLQDYAYREAPYVFYRKGTYYFLWSVDDTGSPNYHVAYGTSKSPLGPITVAKDPIVLRQDPENKIYGTAHNSVLQIPGKDQWYIVYHRINKHHIERVMGPGIHREVCIDALTFDKKGNIVEVKPTLNGPAAVQMKKKK
ncbi:MAG: family 43 glycosylhydrolase [Bacteroides sp.]|nr:family 43 glycosylhydrolase [Roseburia sp.]MCM1346778.1 family 43 glycosylhydrolase [Bacteroides sp.]MCM1420656.1 family 43 glycosylhydrolase [Bacteroides sp.]